ncbi:hypothetical protein [Streptomyces sp. WMMB303]|uniref:hypothetical protein n=1 Tax=Streptomyces sp. WMMB303 TaxID=3034154 RepID=UPI0023ECC725|nr:hypothetical protein [Streptomyces sp. WMMB303]MDF4254662.1 hypothetical protein [Streptomyces sp. WMMB303]MDF4254699.1 hypothetical protein [Streptomyces sp. WMMB303]
MSTQGAERRGHVLMLAGDTATHRRRPQLLPSHNLAALATAPAQALLGTTDPTDVAMLDGARDPHLVRARLQMAADTSGDLLVYLSARLVVDRKSHALHLALPGATKPTVRYTALPWDWLRTELRNRPPMTTTLAVDLVAEPQAVSVLAAGEAERLAAGLTLVGVISPSTAPTVTGPSPYTRHLAERLRQGEGPVAQLHPQAVAAADLPADTLVLPVAPQQAALPAPPPTSRTQMLPRRRLEADADDVAPGLESRPALDPALLPSAAPAPTRPPAPEPALAPESRAPHPTVPARPTAPVPVPAQRPAALAEPGTGQQDPRPRIHALAQAGRHREAAREAQVWEQHVLQTCGIDSPQATQWLEIRADLAKMATDFTLATHLWIAAGRTRLAHQATDAPEVLTAGQSAHYCWTHIQDPAKARDCGPDLISLLRTLPALDRRHLSMAQQRLEYLQQMTR